MCNHPLGSTVNLHKARIFFFFFSRERAGCFQSLTNVDFFLYIFVGGKKCLVINGISPHGDCTEDKTLARAKRLAPQRHAAPDLLADAHILQESKRQDVTLTLRNKPSSW